MAEGLAGTMVIYPAQFHSGMYEVLARNLNAFNAASNNALILESEILPGDYAAESFYKTPTSAVTRRDTTSTSAASIVDIATDEEKAPKLNRKFGPFQKSVDAWRKIGKDAQEMSFVLGQMAAEEILRDQLDAAVAAAEAAIQSQAAMIYDATELSTKTLTHAALANGLAKMGDVASRITAWVLHSKPHFDLVQQALTDKITNVADAVIYGASPGTLGRIPIVTDSAQLTDANGTATDTYNTLGLVPGAVRVKVSETMAPSFIPVPSKENQLWEFRVEFAYDVFVKGMKFDVTVVNPTVAQLGTHTNWTLAAASAKNAAGVRIVTQ